MLQTILRNLMSNAVKFTSGGGTINLSAKATDAKSVEISVQDSGIGMNSVLLDNLFCINGQTNRRGTADEVSTGLGLIICKKMIEKLAGQILVESEEGKGSNFRLLIPGNSPPPR
jgi:signal transduction histidine kinase